VSLKILWLSHLLPFPPIGGVRQRSFNLLKEIALRHSVTLVALSQKAQQKTERDIQKSIVGLSQFCDKVYVFPMGTDRSRFTKRWTLFRSFFILRCYLTEWVKSPEFREKLIQLCTSQEYDVIYLDCIALVPFLKVLPPTPKILNHHNVESQLMFTRAKNETNIFARAYCFQEAVKRKFIEKKYCPQFNVNICVSELDKLRLKEVSKKITCIHVIKNGVDLERLWPPERNFQCSNILLFVGGMTRFPNRDAMVYFAKDIWPKLEKSIPEIKMVVIGSNPDSYLLQLSEKVNNFEVKGFVEDVKPYYDAATILVCPVRDGGGTRLKILDSFSAERAVVSTPLGAEGIGAEDGREILIARTAEEFANKIIFLIQNPEVRKNIERNARLFVEKHYDFRKIGQELNYIFESLI
jgi:glycosyltransferase involved in cell wall biosynthesis